MLLSRRYQAISGQVSFIDYLSKQLTLFDTPAECVLNILFDIQGAFWKRIVHVRVMESFIPLVRELEETAILGKIFVIKSLNSML